MDAHGKVPGGLEAPHSDQVAAANGACQFVGYRLTSVQRFLLRFKPAQSNGSAGRWVRRVLIDDR